MHIWDMKLSDYLNSENLTDAALAERIKVDRSTVTRLRGGQIPSPEVMKEIARVTDGMVTPNDFYDLPASAAGMAA